MRPHVNLPGIDQASRRFFVNVQQEKSFEEDFEDFKKEDYPLEPRQKVTVMPTRSRTYPTLRDYLNESKFFRLKTQWLNSINAGMRLKEMMVLGPYQQIIGMGQAALPFIFNELRTEPRYWFWALESITCENPISE